MDYTNFMNDYDKTQNNIDMTYQSNETYIQLSIWLSGNTKLFTEIIQYLFILTVIPNYSLHAIFIYILFRTHKTEKTVMIFRK